MPVDQKPASGLKVGVRKLLPRRLTSHRVLFGPLRGAQIVTSWHDYPGAILGRTERPLLQWFHRNVDSSQTWIDVGAHYGYTAIALARLVGDRGRVIAFEPVIRTAGCVSQTRELNRLSQLTTVPLGLDSGASLRTMELPTVRGMADSTIGRSAWTERILVGSLDALWPSLCDGNPSIHGIKIDVQGMELDVLAGMRETLRVHRPTIIVELHAGVDRAAVLGALEQCGYQGPGVPIEVNEDRARPLYRDDCSYVFEAQ